MFMSIPLYILVLIAVVIKVLIYCSVNIFSFIFCITELTETLTNDVDEDMGLPENVDAVENGE